ncbi:MAG: PRC-barrel domain-containing protein [Desulfobulbaceae bacterium]|nr:PRC-barrel domain-containing protein [Desulfobulbaceae bacterium]
MQVYRRFSELKEYHLEARDGRIGVPEALYFDDRDWKVRYLVVQTGIWIFGRDVLITPDRLKEVDETKKILAVDLTREQVKNSPPVATERPVSRHYEEKYYLYYGWQPYWSSSPLTLPGIKPRSYSSPDEINTVEQPEDNHLRSSREVTGYAIHSADGLAGHVRDFIVADEQWVIRYLEVDTGNWLPGRKILVSPAWIKEVDWIRKEVTVNLSRAAIESAPEYDHDRLISREYELQLFRHYSTSAGNDGDGA